MFFWGGEGVWVGVRATVANSNYSVGYVSKNKVNPNLFCKHVAQRWPQAHMKPSASCTLNDKAL